MNKIKSFSKHFKGWRWLCFFLLKRKKNKHSPKTLLKERSSSLASDLRSLPQVSEVSGVRAVGGQR